MAETLTNPHDSFFRQVMSRLDVATDFLRHYLPTEATATEADLRQAMEQHWPAGVTIMDTVADTWIKRGMQQGTQQGIQQGLEQGLRHGRRQGLVDAISLGIRLRFGSEGLPLLPEIRKIEDVEVLEAIYNGFETDNSLDELRRIYAQPQP